MRESIGTVSLLNFVLFFIFLVFAFLAGSMSYYKAFRVNNLMVSAIEKYEGFNEYAKEEIDVSVSNLGYENVDFNCPNTKGEKGYLVKLGNDNVQNWNMNDAYSTGDRGYSGYCVYRTRNDQINSDSDKAYYTDQYDVYEVVTIISFKFPVVQDLIKLRVSAKTDRIYNFEASSAALNSSNGEGWGK